jgi:hypothetical protein
VRLVDIAQGGIVVMLDEELRVLRRHYQFDGGRIGQVVFFDD